MYVLAPNQTVTTYPFSFTSLRLAHLQTSFPSIMSNDRFADFNVYPVTPTDAPAHDPITETLTELNPVLTDGAWVQTWSIESASQETITARQQAAAAIINKNQYGNRTVSTSDPSGGTDGDIWLKV